MFQILETIGYGEIAGDVIVFVISAIFFIFIFDQFAMIRKIKIKTLTSKKNE